jgi:hypothetical protein
MPFDPTVIRFALGSVGCPRVNGGNGRAGAY